MLVERVEQCSDRFVDRTKRLLGVPPQLRDAVDRFRRELCHPRRLVGHVGLVDARTQERSHGGRPDMSGCGRRRSVNGVRGEHQEERFVAGCLAHRAHTDAGEHIGRVGGRAVTVRRLRAIRVTKSVVEVGPIGLGERVPRRPSRRHVSGRRAVVAVEVLADQDGTVARLLQPHGQGAVLEAGLVEDGPTARVRDVIAATVRPYARRMGEQPGQQRSPRGATHRRRDHAVGISRAALEDPPADRIHPVDGAIPLVVGDDEEHVRHACPSPSEADGHLLLDNRSSTRETAYGRSARLARLSRHPSGYHPGMEQPALIGLTIVGATFLLFVILAWATATDVDVRASFGAHRSSEMSTRYPATRKQIEHACPLCGVACP